MPVDLAGSRVLLTGATGGLGHAIARALHAEGAKLVLTGRRSDVLDPLAEEIGATAIGADLSSRDGIARLLDEAGDVDVLIANAALPGTGALGDYTVEEIEARIAVNLTAPILMTKAVLPSMLERRSGHIVLVGSMSSLITSPASAMYNATKFGLRGFAGSLRQDVRGTGVGVSLVMPGFVRDAGMALEEGLLDRLPRGVRTVSPQQVADGVVRAIRKDKGEVVVAPVELRLSALFGSVMPEVSAAMQQAAGAADVTNQPKDPTA